MRPVVVQPVHRIAVPPGIRCPYTSTVTAIDRRLPRALDQGNGSSRRSQLHGHEQQERPKPNVSLALDQWIGSRRARRASPEGSGAQGPPRVTAGVRGAAPSE